VASHKKRERERGREAVCAAVCRLSAEVSLPVPPLSTPQVFPPTERAIAIYDVKNHILKNVSPGDGGGL